MAHVSKCQSGLLSCTHKKIPKAALLVVTIEGEVVAIGVNLSFVENRLKTEKSLIKKRNHLKLNWY